GFRGFDEAPFPKLCVVPSPATADHAKVCKPQYHGLGKIGEHHAHIPDRLKPADISELVFEFPHRNTEEIPGDLISICSCNPPVYNVFTPHAELAGSQVDII